MRFLVHLIVLISLLSASASLGSSGGDDASSQKTQRQLLPECEWCGAQDASDLDSLDWDIVIPPEDEPGERLVISGTVYMPDGKTPAEGIIVYVYHTNSEGVYPKRGDETGNGRRHGYLRGWMKTNAEGRYRFETIKPAPYPTKNRGPAHIHYTISGPDFDEYWLNSLWFEGDPLITEKEKAKVTRSGGFSNIVALTKDEDGVLHGTRDIILEEDR
jgi:protocatechuate 3,4-dioxygenase beta subunit